MCEESRKLDMEKIAASERVEMTASLRGVGLLYVLGHRRVVKYRPQDSDYRRSTSDSTMEARFCNLKGISLGLGEKTPCVIFDDADLDQAIKWAESCMFFRLYILSNVSHH